jgi:hypothetical protein
MSIAVIGLALCFHLLSKLGCNGPDLFTSWSERSIAHCLQQCLTSVQVRMYSLKPLVLPERVPPSQFFAAIDFNAGL